MARVVVKIGSSLLTEPCGGLSLAALERHVARLVALRAAGHEVILVSSGAVAAGFAALGYSQRPESVVARQACAALGQGKLIHAYSQAFSQYDIAVAQVLLTQFDFSRRRSYNNALNALQLLLEKQALPIINENDTVAVRELTFGDNDILAALVSALLHAEQLIILTDVDGVYDQDPATVATAAVIPRINKITRDLYRITGSTGSNVGTGGMLAKVKAADVALSMGIQVYIGSGRADATETLEAVVSGSGSGTYFASNGESPLGRKKQWIAFHSEVSGQIIIDAGAEQALVHGGSSLLPVGVVRVRGTIVPGDVVEVFSDSGVLLGKGICELSSADLEQARGRTSDYVKKELSLDRTEVVHRDNWVNVLVEHQKEVATLLER